MARIAARLSLGGVPLKSGKVQKLGHSQPADFETHDLKPNGTSVAAKSCSSCLCKMKAQESHDEKKTIDEQ